LLHDNVMAIIFIQAQWSLLGIWYQTEIVHKNKSTYFFTNKDIMLVLSVLQIRIRIQRGPWIRIRVRNSDPDPDSLDMPDPDPDSMNPDPQHWFCIIG
jgi:hypothetical protein